MRKGRLQVVASVVILVATFALFARYLQTHPQYVSELKTTDPWWIVAIVTANFFLITVLAFISLVLIKMVGKTIGTTENWLLTIYSSIANFFGPLQSGPGVRAAYLKTKHQVSLRSYFLVMLLAYGVYAVMSAFMLLIGTRPWWQALLACLGAAAVSFVVIRFAGRRRKQDLMSLHIQPVYIALLIGLTALQLVFTSLRYYLAIRASGNDVTLGQLVSYTGAANFALFVSITPDGIGIREAFLLFSQNIHQVSTDTIVAANLIDRATYVLFLGILFLIALSLHAKERLKLPTTRANQSVDEPDAPMPPSKT
ncbi:flippase-like domain-containing protein [Candidatus Saccharibacteria bacterium]|nr:flippase-like domain-containing protein [Candidatus Saccharibacteria bacterium]